MTGPVARPYVKVLRVPAPVAGADWTLVAGEGALWRVVTVRASLTTSAAVANRTARLVADDGTDEFFRTVAPSVVTAGLTTAHAAFSGSAAQALAAASVTLAWPTHGLVLPRGHRLRSLTDLIDIADQWSAVAVEVEVYPETAGGEWLPGPAPYLTQEY